MIVLLPETEKTELGNSARCWPISLGGSLLPDPKIPGLEQTPLTFSKVWPLSERLRPGIFPCTVLQLQNSGYDLLVQENLHISTSKTWCDYKALSCFSFHRLFLFPEREFEKEEYLRCYLAQKQFCREECHPRGFPSQVNFSPLLNE